MDLFGQLALTFRDHASDVSPFDVEADEDASLRLLATDVHRAVFGDEGPIKDNLSPESYPIRLLRLSRNERRVYAAARAVYDK